uniref:Uncharacterized protein n=1 Tax=Candidatus Kentrum sp. LPFa TaxID=2126335 RepID=A0A450WTJ2_9GAMM|nr:MAG: hypothetical protein BECKLPF1236B_GA0070989_12071 [Candidatus Kentron sp. LPFa]
MDCWIFLLAPALSYVMLCIGACWIWNKLPKKPERREAEPDWEAFETAVNHRIKATIVILVLSTILGVASLFTLVLTK